MGEKPEDDDALNALAKDILRSLRRSRSKKALFKYLWDNRHKNLSAEVIWADVLSDVSRSNAKASEHDDAQSVRDRCRELRSSLKDYREHAKGCYAVDLPPASEGEGYRLDIIETDFQRNPVLDFWRPHLEPGRDIFIVYVEHPYYHCWPERFVFRYHDSDQGNEVLALSELQKNHLQTYEAYKDGLTVVYSLVASGAISARDRITEWFERVPFVKVKNVVSRHVQHAGAVWNGSLILFNGAHSNSLIDEVLKRTTDLQLIHQHEVVASGRQPWRVLVKNPSDQEMSKFSRYNPVQVEGGCILEFRPELGTVLAILTRVPNPHRRDTIVTIIDCDFGRVLQQFGRWLTEETEIRRFSPPSECFQMLIAVDIPSLSDDDRRSEPEILACRSLGVSRTAR